MNNTKEFCNGDILSDNQKAAPTRRKPSKSRQNHGLTPLIKGRYKADAGQLDGRCKPMQLLAGYRRDLLNSLGGPDNLSEQELCLIEVCARDRMILESIDAFLLQTGTLNRKKRTAFPITLQRMQIADSLTRRLQSLGLGRRVKPVSSLAELLQTSPRNEQT